MGPLARTPLRACRCHSTKISSDIINRTGRVASAINPTQALAVPPGGVVAFAWQHSTPPDTPCCQPEAKAAARRGRRPAPSATGASAARRRRKPAPGSTQRRQTKTPRLDTGGQRMLPGRGPCLAKAAGRLERDGRLRGRIRPPTRTDNPSLQGLPGDPDGQSESAESAGRWGLTAPTHGPDDGLGPASRPGRRARGHRL